MSSAYRFACAGLLAAVLFAWSLFLTQPLSSGMGQDFTTMYVGAVAWLGGVNPYTSHAPAAIAANLHIAQQGVVNSPLVLLLDAPLTRWQPHTALLIYIAIQYLLVALGAWLLTSDMLRRTRVLLTLAVLASPACLLIGYYGQIGSLVFLCVAAGIWARRAGRWSLLGLCVAAAVVKPQLALCAAVPLLWGAPRQAWLAACATLTTLVGIMALMLTPAGVLGYLDVMRRFNASPFARANDDGLGISALYKGWLAAPWSISLTWLLSLALVAAMALLVWRYRWRPTNGVLAAAMCIGALILPYSHQYDSIALLPALYMALSARLAGSGRRWLVVVGAAVVIVTPLMAISSHQVPFRLLPLGLIMCAIATTEGRSAPVTTTMVSPSRAA